VHCELAGRCGDSYEQLAHGSSTPRPGKQRTMPTQPQHNASAWPAIVVRLRAEIIESRAKVRRGQVLLVRAHTEAAVRPADRRCAVGACCLGAPHKAPARQAQVEPLINHATDARLRLRQELPTGCGRRDARDVRVAP
jgi:hypothetical protein